MIAPRLPMTVSQVKPLSVRDGKPGWAQSGVTVPSAHKGIFNSHILTILKTDFLLPSSQRGPDLTTMKTSRKFPLLPSPSPLHSHPKRKEFILQSTSSAKCFHSPGQVDGPLLWSPFRVWREHLKVTCDPVQKQRIGTLKVPRVPDYYRKFTSRCSPSNPSGSNLLRNPGGSVSVLDNKTQSPMGATLELQNICPI